MGHSFGAILFRPSVSYLGGHSLHPFCLMEEMELSSVHAGETEAQSSGIQGCSITPVLFQLDLLPWRARGVSSKQGVLSFGAGSSAGKRPGWAHTGCNASPGAGRWPTCSQRPGTPPGPGAALSGPLSPWSSQTR